MFIISLTVHRKTNFLVNLYWDNKYSDSDIPIAHCHHQNDSCIKVGSDERRFNVSLIVRDKDSAVSTYQNLCLERKESRCGFEPRSLS